MRRTREWWARLLPYQRNELWYLERGRKVHGAGLFECEGCAGFVSGGGLCPTCEQRYQALLYKANGEANHGEGNELARVVAE